MSRNFRLMLIGGSMLIVGWIILMGVVIELIPSFIWLNFISYGLTLVGFIIGSIGTTDQIRQIRAQRNEEDNQ